MRIEVGDGSISFTMEDGTCEKVTAATLTDIDGDTNQAYLLSQIGLIGMGCFFQLSQLNHLFGSIDLEAKEGKGLLGMAGQQVISLTEISAHLGRLMTELQLLKEWTEKQTANVADPAQIMKDAMATAREMMSSLPGGQHVSHPHQES